MLAKVLFSHQNYIIGSLIHRDQVGFIHLRQARDKVYRAVLLAHAAHAQHIPTFLLLLDIKKALDTVSCLYLHFILHHWGFSPNFLNGISSLYDNPRVYLKYGGYNSDPFNICSGTWQGCHLLPLLFAFTIKAMAQLIRADPNIKDLEI